MQARAPQILLRSPRIAQRVFGLDSPGQIVRSVPRAKFMFKAEFFPSAAANSMLNNANLNSSTDIRSVAFKVKSIDKPKVSFTTVELNHYNKKHLAYTKAEYGESQIRIYDTVDNSMLALWVNYFTYFFGDSRTGKDDETDYRQSPVSPKYYDSSGWGFRPISENVQFFDSIDITAFYGQTITTFRYMNPRITSIDWQTKDYSSSDLEEITVSFKYEAINYEKFGQPASDFDSGWLPSDTIDYPYGYASAPAAYQPRMFTKQTATFNNPQAFSTQSNPANIVGGLPYNTGAIAPGATIPNSLLNNQLLQPNNLVAGLAMAMNYIPNGIKGVNNFPFATVASLAGIKGIGGASQLLGDAIRTQVAGIGAGISSLFNSSQVQNVYTGGIPQPPDYMNCSTSSPLPDITTNNDFGIDSKVDPGAIGGSATTPADLSTSDLGIGTGGQGSAGIGGDDLGIGASGLGEGGSLTDPVAVEVSDNTPIGESPAEDFTYQGTDFNSSYFNG